MSILNFKHRLDEIEIMDDFNLSSPSLYETLDEIESLNKWLGGHKIIIKALKKCIPPKVSKTISIVDLGCGKGDGLIEIKKELGNKYSLHLKGLDANIHTIEYARKSFGSEGIEFDHQTIDDQYLKQLGCDVVIMSLFFHHFSTEEIQRMLKALSQSNINYIVINDLQRSKLAWILFQLVARMFGLGKMARYDGSISIRKGFVKKELRRLISYHFNSFEIKWHWAFRYMVIIDNK